VVVVDNIVAVCGLSIMDFVVSNNLAICNVDFVASVLVTSGSTGIQCVDSNVN
jgi:hypothetical protein